MAGELSRRQFLVQAGSVVAGAIAICACAPSGGEEAVSAGEAAPAGDRPTIVLYSQNEGPDENSLWQSLVDWSKEELGIEVETSIQPADYQNMLYTMFAAGVAPDIFHMGTFDFPMYLSQGFLVPLDGAMAAGFNRDEFIETAINAFTSGGSMYGIPRDFSTLALFYNANIFDQFGVAAPTDDWTWTELEETGWSISKNAFSVTANPYHFAVFVFQNGGQIMNEDFSDTLIDSPEAIEAGNFYIGARLNGWAVLPEDMGVSSQSEVFGRGEIAMVLEGAWLRSYLTTQFPDLRYGAVHPPANKNEGNLLFSTAYAVSSSSNNGEMATALIASLTSEEKQIEVLKSGLAVPARKSLEGYTDDAVVRSVFSSAWFATPYTWGSVGSVVNESLRWALERAHRKEMSVEESFLQAAAEMRAGLQ
jgi:multiple sugar transport system substrate-binding protein